MTHRRSLARAALIVAACIPGVLAAQQSSSAPVAIDRWLVLGPLPAHAPAFGAATDSVLLSANQLSITHGWPASGHTVEWLDGRSVAWAEDAAPNGALHVAASPAQSVVFAVAYLDTDGWQKVELSVEGVARQAVSLDGIRVKGSEIELQQGKHILLVEAVQPAGTALTLSARVQSETPGMHVAVSLDPHHAPTLAELMAVRDVRDIAIDPAGEKVAWVTRAIDIANDRFTTLIEVHDLVTGRLLVQLSPEGQASSPTWSRDGKRLAYLTATDEKGSTGRDLWVWTPADGGNERVLRAERGLSSVEWSPKGEWLYFTASSRIGGRETFKPGDVRRLTEVWERPDRWPEKAQLYALNVEQGTRIKLLGDTLFSVEGAQLSPDGSRIIFARSVRTNVAAPWLRAEVWVLDLGTMTTRKLLDLDHESFGAPRNFAWSPDSKAVAFCASAKELLKGKDPTFSVYETELYATNIEHPALEHLSAGFVPAVACNALAWNARDHRIYVTADAGARTVPARTIKPVSSAIEPTSLEEIKMPGEEITAYDFGSNALVAAIQTPTTPPVVYRISLTDGSATMLDHPSAGVLSAQVTMPTWGGWDYTNSKGTRIEGWYWLPPHFDSTKTYPLIVTYYGGTLPMKKGFDERLVWFAANGYVVFMMNPAGTPGYGQAFANLHINDWGYPAGSDIIEGTEQFIKTHRFVDASHVGNFGHSYGGFMTMHLATRTNIFATSIEISGISNIADYWGAGYSGYSYTDGTCPGCYPWNRKDIFVDRSPLFQADKIRTPMLLLHGTDDTNVVPTESEQMFTALRMLGREAELVRFYGENHGINSKPSITRSLYGVMFDWYDKYLRGHPDAWAARWHDDTGGQTARAGVASASQN